MHGWHTSHAALAEVPRSHQDKKAKSYSGPILRCCWLIQIPLGASAIGATIPLGLATCCHDRSRAPTLGLSMSPVGISPLQDIKPPLGWWKPRLLLLPQTAYTGNAAALAPCPPRLTDSIRPPDFWEDSFSHHSLGTWWDGCLEVLPHKCGEPGKCL